MTNQMQRRALGCGYEPRRERVHLTMWQPPTSNGKVGYDGPEPTVCAGYTTSLPEVIETALARMHWLKGNVPLVHDSDLHDALVILDSAYNAVQHWALVPVSEGGGRT